MNYILSSCVLTDAGFYEYRHLSEQQARDWLNRTDWRSTIGYAETAAAASALFGRNIPYRREAITMQAGEEALVFRLVYPKGAPLMPSKIRGTFNPDFVREYCEIGLLKRHHEPAVDDSKAAVIATYLDLDKYLVTDKIEKDFLFSAKPLRPAQIRAGQLSEKNQKGLAAFFRMVGMVLKFKK